MATPKHKLLFGVPYGIAAEQQGTISPDDLPGQAAPPLASCPTADTELVTASSSITVDCDRGFLDLLTLNQ